jgi:acyl-CoA synthetase (AMP-forming)/AMP-acid ligase II
VTVCSVNTHEHFRHGSVGKPLTDMSFTVRDEMQNILPAGAVGEVYIAGNTLMNGYRGEAAATNSTLVILEDKLWVRSGDLGYLDEDGYLFLKSRIKRVFKIAGINIYPAEVEKIATDLSEDVYDAALELFDAPMPHLVLFLVRSRESGRTEEEIRTLLTQQIGEKLTKYCMPQKIVFLDSFPKTKVGKTDHKAFKDV